MIFLVLKLIWWGLNFKFIVKVLCWYWYFFIIFVIVEVNFNICLYIEVYLLGCVIKIVCLYFLGVISIWFIYLLVM